MHRFTLLIALTLAAAALPAAAQGRPNQAAVVIRYGDGHVDATCVTFDEPTISGIDLLQRAGVPVILQTSAAGSAVCKIGGEGCDYPAEDCFCKCKGGDCAYWAYQRLIDGRWRYSQLGATAIQVAPGEVDGWAWGAGSVQGGQMPPAMTFGQICTGAGEPTGAQPAPPTEPASPEATAAPRPTRPPQPTATALPTEAATATPEPTAPAATQPPTEPAATATPPPTEPPATETAPSATPAAIAAAATPEPTAASGAPAQAPPAQGGGQDSLGYLAFAALAAALLAGIAVALRRRGRNP